MRIGIVNDMRLACEALRRVVQASPGLDVAWMAYNGEEAVAQTARDRPDLILMDLIMPVVDGAEATRRIMSQSPCPILVVTSSVTGNISKVYEALGHGAVDAVDTPILGTGGQLTGAQPLLDKIATINKLYGQRTTRTPLPGKSAPSPSRTPAQPASPAATTRHAGPVLIGASTGGPTALKAILEALPANLPAGIVIVQHVDEAFTPGLARWLDKHARLIVDLAIAGDTPTPGKALLAHTNDHLAFNSEGRLFYTVEPAGEYYRPSVDVLFHSVLRSNLPPGAAVLLTGMGRDGAEGLAALRRAGWHTIAQDRATSVVYGMPKAAAELNAAVQILPIQEIAQAITRSLAPA
jgi:two-component system response regulator WspF